MPTNNPFQFIPNSDSDPMDKIRDVFEYYINKNQEEQAKKEAREEASNNLTSSINDQMSLVSDVVKKVARKFKSNPCYTTYIEFKINDLVLCNTSKESTQNIIMSLQVKNNGSGYANSFALQICYTPSVYMFEEGWGPNTLEEKLMAASYSNEDFSSRYCTLRYGYGDDEDLKTKEFLGIVIDYTCNIQDGMLVYDITGYSSIAAINESKEPISVKLTETEKTNGIQPTLAVERIVKTYLQQPSPNKTVTDSEGNKLTLESSPVSDLVNYDIQFVGDTLLSDATTIIGTQLDKNISQAITDILNKAVYKKDAEVPDDDKNLNILNKSKYGWFIDDRETKDGQYKGTIYVYRLTPDDNKDANVDIIFNWMAPGEGELDHIVTSFQPEFKGQVLLSLSSQRFNPINDKNENAQPEEKTPEEMNQIFNGSYYLSNDGKICKTEKSISPPIGGTSQAAIGSIEQEKATWLEDAQYCYKATLITMGIPCHIPITGRIKVVPLIYTIPHHSQGVYLINGTTDQITSNGFFTTWNLMKYIEEVKGKNTDIDTSNENDNQNNSHFNNVTRPKPGDPDFVGPLTPEYYKN